VSSRLVSSHWRTSSFRSWRGGKFNGIRCMSPTHAERGLKRYATTLPSCDGISFSATLSLLPGSQQSRLGGFRRQLVATGTKRYVLRNARLASGVTHSSQT